MAVSDLGERICIMGPSNSGKSSLAVALGRSQRLPVVHLDQYRHIEGSPWHLRSDDEFAHLHDRAVSADRWIIEGNYSALLAQRLSRATGLILLDCSTPASLFRYIKRTLGPASRAGGLDGVKDTIRWSMIRYMLGPARQNRRRYRKTYEHLSLPKVFIADRTQLRRFYRDEAIERI